MLAAGAGVLGAVPDRLLEDARRSTSAWPATARSARLVGITAPSGYVESWAAPIIGLVAGVIVPLGVYAIDKKLDDPVGALSAHGLCGIWGTLACGLFTSPRLAEYNGIRRARPGLLRLVRPARHAGARRRSPCSLRVRALLSSRSGRSRRRSACASTPRTEEAGLDIAEHGMYGYPEQFIPHAGAVRLRDADRTASRDNPSRRPAHPEERCPRMKKIEAYIRHEAFEPIRRELLDARLPVAVDLRGQGLGAPEGRSRSAIAARS